MPSCPASAPTGTGRVGSGRSPTCRTAFSPDNTWVVITRTVAARCPHGTAQNRQSGWPWFAGHACDGGREPTRCYSCRTHFEHRRNSLFRPNHIGASAPAYCSHCARSPTEVFTKHRSGKPSAAVAAVAGVAALAGVFAGCTDHSTATAAAVGADFIKGTHDESIA